MGKRTDTNALYWRSIRLHKVGLIRHAIVNGGGTLKGAAEYLGVSAKCLQMEVSKLKAEGYYVRDSDQESSNSSDTSDGEAGKDQDV